MSGEYPFEERNKLLNTILSFPKQTVQDRQMLVLALTKFISNEENLLSENVDIPQKKSHALARAKHELSLLQVAVNQPRPATLAPPPPPPLFQPLFQAPAVAQVQPTARALNFG
jgi:hypothetical protein